MQSSLLHSTIQEDKGGLLINIRSSEQASSFMSFCVSKEKDYFSFHHISSTDTPPAVLLSQIHSSI